MLTPAPPRLLSPFEQTEVADIDLSNSMDGAQQSFSNSLAYDAADEITPQMDEPEDGHAAMVRLLPLGISKLVLNSGPCSGRSLTQQREARQLPARRTHRVILQEARTSDENQSYHYHLMSCGNYRSINLWTKCSAGLHKCLLYSVAM